MSVTELLVFRAPEWPTVTAWSRLSSRLSSSSITLAWVGLKEYVLREYELKDLLFHGTRRAYPPLLLLPCERFPMHVSFFG